MGFFFGVFCLLVRVVLLSFFPCTTKLVTRSFFEKAERLLGKLFEVSAFSGRYLKICQVFLVI